MRLGFEKFTANWSMRVYIAMAYFGGLGVLRLLHKGLSMFSLMSVGLFWLGAVVGMFFRLIDQLVYVYYVAPKDPLSVDIQALVKTSKWKEVIGVLDKRREEQIKLSMHNVLFMGAWAAVTLFIMTSSPSYFSKGMVLGIGLELAMSLWQGWKNKQVLVRNLFWPVQRPVGQEELKWVVITFGVVLFVASGLWI